MAQFSFPRFAGNPVLQEILDDPDTGTKKLQKGSDFAAVVLVQDVLYDLNWAQSFPGEDHYPARTKFVDGDYGPTTSRTVEVYKTHYRIVYPPGDPNGFIDAFAGPRTLERLDRQIAVLDDLRDVILEKIGQLQDAGAPIRLRSIEEEPPPLQPWLGSGGSVRWWTTWGEDGPGLETGVMIASKEHGAFEIHGPIFRRWYELQGVTGHYGPPVSDVEDDGSGGSVSRFTNGTIGVDASGTVVENPGPTAFAPPTGDGAIV